MRDLAGRTALVTGATGGIGHSVAERLAAEGMHVAVSARTADALERLVERITAAGGTAFAFPTDLADARAVDALVARVEEIAGPVDVLVNNAGIELASAYTDLTVEEIEACVAVNLTAPMLLIRRVLPGMLERADGHVVNMASIAGKGASPFEAAYAATKAALVGLTRSLRAEYLAAPVGFSVVCPGFVQREGMYARMAREGFRAPRSFTAVRMDEVVDAVAAVIRDDRPEVIVTRRPLRPLVALNELFPRLGEHVAEWAGVRRFLGAVAQRRAGTRRA